MRAKTFLNQYSILKMKLNRKKDVIERLNSLIQSPSTSTLISDEKISHSGSSRIEELVVKKETFERELSEIIKATAKHLVMIEKMINEMTEPLYSQILYLRYVKYDRNVTLEYIADEIHYSYDYVKKLHGMALNAFQDKYASYLAKI